MFVEFAVNLRIYKGIVKSETAMKTLIVALDDLPDDLGEHELRVLITQETHTQMRRKPDYRLYGKNWDILSLKKI